MHALMRYACFSLLLPALHIVCCANTQCRRARRTLQHAPSLHAPTTDFDATTCLADITSHAAGYDIFDFRHAAARLPAFDAACRLDFLPVYARDDTLCMPRGAPLSA